MKNHKLFTSIQNLITKKQAQSNSQAQSSTNLHKNHKKKQNFAQQYCNQQLKKKKLTPKNCTSKIDSLMKNFKRINTFVDVDDLISVVNQIYVEEEKEIKKSMVLENSGNGCVDNLNCSNSNQINSNTFANYNNNQVSSLPAPSTSHKKYTSQLYQNPPYLNLNPNLTIYPSLPSPTTTLTLTALSEPQPEILNKAKQALKQYHQNLYMKQNQNIGNFLEQFQKSSNYLSQVLGNKQRYGFLAGFCKRRVAGKGRSNGHSTVGNSNNQLSAQRQKSKHADQEQQQPPKQKQKQKQKWNLYSKAHNPTAYTKTQPNQQTSSTIQMKNYQPINKYKKKKKLFDLAQIYLQIILQDQYRKKWNKAGSSVGRMIAGNDGNGGNGGEDANQRRNYSGFRNYSGYSKGKESYISKMSSVRKQQPSIPLNNQKRINESQKKSQKFTIQSNPSTNLNIDQQNPNLLKPTSKHSTLTLLNHQDHQTASSTHNSKTFPISRSSLKRPTKRNQTRSNTKFNRYKDIDVAIRKVNNFLMELELDQSCLKNQKKLHLNHLDKLEKHIDQQNLLRSNKIWKDQEKCQQIRVALKRFDRK